MKKHLCSYHPDHLICSDLFCPSWRWFKPGCPCRVAAPVLPLAGAHGDRLRLPKDRRFLLLRGASSKGWSSTGSIWYVECVEGGREGVHKSSNRCWASFRILKTALSPVMIPRTPDYSLRNSPSAREQDIYAKSVENYILSKLEPVRFPAPDTHTLFFKK